MDILLEVLTFNYSAQYNTTTTGYVPSGGSGVQPAWASFKLQQCLAAKWAD